MKTFLSIAFLFTTLVLTGQDNHAKPSIAERYPGGAIELRQFIAKNLRFPQASAETGRVGLSISSITITPEGRIDNAAIHNSLGEEIDMAVANSLYTTEGQWLTTKDYTYNQTFYFQVSYELQSSGRDAHFTIQGDSILEEIQIFSAGYTPPYFETNQSLKRNLHRSIQKEQYNQSLDILEEFIRRDPFNINYYEIQAKCYEGLDRVTTGAEVEGRIQKYRTHNALAILKEPVLYGNIVIVKPLDDGSFSIRELYRDSTMVYSGKLAYVNPDVRQGKYYFFNREGKVSVSGEYQNDLPVGTWNYYNAEGQITKSLDYSAVVKFLLNEKANPLIDSTFMDSDNPMMNPDGSFAIVETMPLFNDNDPAIEFTNYIIKQLQYPIFAKTKKYEGKVIVQFTVDKDGLVRDPQIVRSAHTDLNMEALRIITNSPKWIPGKIGDRNANVVFTFPVIFRLTETFFTIESIFNPR